MRRAFTLIEILVVLTIIATLGGLVSTLVTTSTGQAHRMECSHNVRQLVGLLEFTGSRRYPAASGPALLHYLVLRGELAGDDALQLLFCPGDFEESLEQAGGEVGVMAIAKGEAFAHATSYAGRALTESGCRASPSANRAVVLLSDDSDDHHHGKGIVVGLTGGTVRWRDKIDAYKLGRDDAITIGSSSTVEELRCLRSE